MKLADNLGFGDLAFAASRIAQVRKVFYLVYLTFSLTSCLTYTQSWKHMLYECNCPGITRHS